MNVEQLTSILKEYPMSRKLLVVIDGQTMRETSVAEAVCDLIQAQPSELLTFFGRNNCIIRERGDFTNDVAGAAPYKQWLEIDLR